MRAIHRILAFVLTMSAFATPGWKVRESSEAVELLTPYGVKELVGELAPKGTDAYRVEIPLEDLKPPPKEDSDREPAAHQRWETIIEKEIVKSGTETNTVSNNSNTSNTGDGFYGPQPLGSYPRVIVEYDDSDRYVVEANRLFNRGKFYDATNVVEELLRKKPDHVRGWVMKGSLMKVQGHKESAKNAYLTALKLDPNNTELRKIVEAYIK